MRTLAFFCSAALLSANITTHGCVTWPASHVKGTGEVVQRTLAVQDFHGIVVQGSIDVELTPSAERKVTVEAQANIADLVTTEVRGGIWYVTTKESYSTDKAFVVHISLPVLDRVTVQGSGDVKGKGAFQMNDLSVGVEGSGDVTLEVKAQRVSASVAGSGDIKLSGSCTQVKVDVAGSGDVNAKELRSSQAMVEVAGSGDVSVNTSEELRASIVGSGNVVYQGGPKVVNKNISGSGDVREMGRTMSGTR